MPWRSGRSQEPRKLLQVGPIFHRTPAASFTIEPRPGLCLNQTRVPVRHVISRAARMLSGRVSLSGWPVPGDSWVLVGPVFATDLPRQEPRPIARYVSNITLFCAHLRKRFADTLGWAGFCLKGC